MLATHLREEQFRCSVQKMEGDNSDPTPPIQDEGGRERVREDRRQTLRSPAMEERSLGTEERVGTVNPGEALPARRRAGAPVGKSPFTLGPLGGLRNRMAAVTRETVQWQEPDGRRSSSIVGNPTRPCKERKYRKKRTDKLTARPCKESKFRKKKTDKLATRPCKECKFRKKKTDKLTAKPCKECKFRKIETDKLTARPCKEWKFRKKKTDKLTARPCKEC